MPEFTVIVTRAGTVKIKDAKTSEEAMEKAQALSAGDIQWDDDFIATDVSGVRLSSGEDVRTALAGCDGRIRRPAQLRRRRPHSPRRLRRIHLRKLRTPAQKHRQGRRMQRLRNALLRELHRRTHEPSMRRLKHERI